MSTNNEDSNKIHFKKLDPKMNSIGKINFNNLLLKRNNSNNKLLEGIINNKITNKNNIRKGQISPFKNHFNQSLSSTILKKANDSLKKSKKYYIKSPLTLFKNNNNNPTISKDIEFNKNIPLLPLNINKSSKPNNNHRSVEYNTINYIINNFNLSYKNSDYLVDKKTNSINKFNNNKYYDFFSKNNHKLKNLNIIKKNNSVNNIKNISNISENNNSNRNNLNDESKADEIIFENQQKQIKIQQRNQENKKKLMILKELEKRNQKLKIEYQEIKTKNIEYSKSLERLLKFLKVLKKSGLEISEIMDNISSGEDYDEFNGDSEEEEEQTDKNKKNESKMSNTSVPLSSLNNLSSGQLKNHEEYSGSKLYLNKKNNIPILNFSKIKNQ